MIILRCAAFAAALLPLHLFAAETITVITAPGAHPLETRAAKWIAESLTLAVDAEVRVADAPPSPPAEGTRIAVGIGKFPDGCTRGTHRVTNRGRDFAVEGDSPVSVLWAAAELVRHLGVRPTLQGDYGPTAKGPSIQPFQTTLAPRVQERVWNGIHDGSHSLAAWPAEALQKTFSQLAKLKFTHVVFPAAPASFAPIRVTGDTAGRIAFRGASFFSPPDPNGYAKAVRAAAAEAGLEVLETAEKDQSWVALGPDNASVLPGFDFPALEKKVRAVTASHAKRLTVFGGLTGDSNVPAYWVSRACFDSNVSVREAFDDLIAPICGEGVSERLWMGFEHVANARRTLEAVDPRLGVPVPGFLSRHVEARTKPSVEMVRLKTLYADAVNEMYRGNTRARGGARPFILYHAKRLEFAMHFMTAVEALSNAGDAAARKQEDARTEALEAAVEAVYNALNAYADAARDPGDLAVIATLNEIGYRPLTQPPQ